MPHMCVCVCQMFEYMPVGAVIEKHILCIHGGIGGTIQTVQDIASLERPLKVSQLPSTPQVKQDDFLTAVCIQVRRRRRHGCDELQRRPRLGVHLCRMQ